ncbi:TetR/AcrR family transcriptional regulator [Georgenia sp. TF02-10]|uniref:TetR/AcrR family transcriptional regulator n=1 Tax=Georgenia sp. TF02-10 TaxID=2917725 RepID=UPI001FA7F626|nr:TetR/AcrR family transcriptional regulator [Georgenia sp. TF02-10]UNX56240.1 TetR/AcrR family transcriptional regulator [Georgenia sp. TF02-10]
MSQQHSERHHSGPVRSAAARNAILDATAHLFEERGYDQLTIEGIAARAGTGKQTVYRWWPSKGALIADCLLEGRILPDAVTPTDTGDLRTDLTAWLDRIFQLLQQPGGEALMRSLIAAAAEHADVGRRLRASLGGDSTLIARLAAAVRAGQLAPDAPLREISEALVGAVLLRALSREAIDADTTARLLAALTGPSRPASGG